MTDSLNFNGVMLQENLIIVMAVCMKYNPREP